MRFFRLELRSVFDVCEEIYQDSFWTQLEEEKTVSPIKLARAVSAINKLDYDVSNHAVALHEKKQPVHVEGNQNKRRKSCRHYNKAKHEKIRSRQTSLGWMGREPKDKEEDSGIKISSTESNDLEDIKSKEKEQTIVKNQNGKISNKKKGSRRSIIENITVMVKSRLKFD